MASLNPMQDLLNSKLSDTAGTPVDTSQPDWYQTYTAGKELQRASAEALKASAAQVATGPYKPEADDPTDVNHPENFFSPERLAQFTTAERAARHKDWMKTQAAKYLTEEGNRTFRASAGVKDNNIFGLTQQATVGENIADTGISLAKGALGAVKAFPDLIGPNAVSEALGGFQTKLESYKSKEAKIDAKAGAINTERAMKALSEVVAGKIASGESANVVTAWASALANNPAEIRAFWKVAVEHPADTLAEGVGSFVTFGIGKAAQLAGASTKAVRVVNTAAGAAQGVGEIKGSIYEQVEAQAKAAGKTPAEAKAIATKAQEYSAENLPRFLAGMGLGALASSTGVEKAFLKDAAKVGAKEADNILVAGAKGFGKEASTEGLQEAQSTEAANNASIRESLMKETERFAGVAGKTATAAAVGGVLGGAVDIKTRDSGGAPAPTAPAGATAQTAPITPTEATAPITAPADTTVAEATAQTAPVEVDDEAIRKRQKERQKVIGLMETSIAFNNEQAQLMTLKRAEDSGLFTDEELLALERGDKVFAVAEDTPESAATTPPATTNVAAEPTQGVQTTQTDATRELPPALQGLPTVALGDPAQKKPRHTPENAHIVAELGTLKASPSYAAAKAGDEAAALEVVASVLTPERVAEITSQVGDATLVPVANYTGKEQNRIPHAFALHLEAEAGLTISTDVMRKTPDGRTEMSGIDRLFDTPKFSGPVTRGQKYFLLDDTITQGGTLAALSRYITSKGGIVTGAAALTGQKRSATLAITKPTLTDLQLKVGNLEGDFHELTGKSFADLTESEGRFIARDVGEFRATVVSRLDGRRNGADAGATQGPAPDNGQASGVKPLLRDQSRDRPGESTFALADDANGGVQTLLAGLATSKDKQVAAWATEILPLLEGVTVRRVATDHPQLNPAGSKTYAMGAYAPSTREVLIPVGDNVTETTLIHELTHAVVDKRMHTPSGEMTRQQNMARETLGDIYNTIAQTIEIAPDTFMGISRYDALKDHNGASSVHEFIAEVRSNPAFRALLQEIPLANGKGQDSRFHLWDVFVKAIRDLLGLDTKNATVLEAADKMIPMMFLPPEARFGKVLPRKMDVGLWAKYGERAEKANTTSWSRKSSEAITQAFADHGVKGKNQILDEMEAAGTTPELRTALETLRQDIILRDVNGATGMLSKTVLDPVTDLIKRLSAAASIDQNELRHTASVLAVARHSKQQSEVRQVTLETAVEETGAMLKNYDIVRDLLKDYDKEITRVTALIDKFTDKLGIENIYALAPLPPGMDNTGLQEEWAGTHLWSVTKRKVLLREMTGIIEQVSAKLDAAGFGPVSPEGKAFSLIKRALYNRKGGYNTSSDLRKITEAAKMFAVDLRAMTGPRSTLKHIHEGRVKLLMDWNAAQANPREVSTDGSGRMVTFGSVKMPGGLRLEESNNIIAGVAASRDADVITEVSVALRDAYKTLTGEAVKAGVITKELADNLHRDSPEYVNTMGQSDADMDTDFTESTLKGYLTPADGSAHLYNSNDTWSNLLARTQKLAVVVANQKVGKSMFNAIEAGSKLFRYERPSQRAQGTAKPGESVQQYLQFNDGKRTHMMTPTTDAGNMMLGRHPNANTPAALQMFAPITSVAGRAVTHLNPAFGPMNLIREIPTRMFNLVGRGSDLVTGDGKAVGITATRGFFLGQALNPATWWEAIAFAATGDESSAIREFKETGGMQTFTERLTNERQVERKFGAGGLTTKLGDGVETVLGFTKKWNTIFETVGVLASYKGLRQAGLSSKQAGFVTLDMMNFRQTGSVTGSILRPVYMFVNATSQDALQLKRSFYNRGQMNYRAVAEAAAIAAAGAMLFSMTRADDEDDEMGGKQMDSLNDGVLYKNLLFKNADGEYTKLPLGFGAFQSMYQMGVAWSRHQSGLITQEAMMEDWFAGFIKNVSITGGSEVSIKKDPVVWFMQTVTPDLLQAPLSVANNKNFAGGNITGTLRKDKYASEQGKWQTPEYFKEVAKSIRETIGWDPAPEQVRALMDGYMLGPLALVQDHFAQTNADREAKGLSVDTSFSGMQKALGVNRIFAKTDETRRAQFQFYKEEEKANDIHKKYDAVIPKDIGARETYDQKVARYNEAGMTAEEYEYVAAKKDYDKTHAEIKKRGDALHNDHMKGIDRSAELTDINQEEAAAMIAFVKQVRGLN